MNVIIRNFLYLFVLITFQVKAHESSLNIRNSDPSINTLEAVSNYFKRANINIEFRAVSEYIDELGLKHIRCQQTYNGYPVDGGDFILHFNKRSLYWINGKYHTISNIDNQIQLSKEESLGRAIEQSASNEYKWECDDHFDVSVPELWISNIEGRQYLYTYKVDVYSIKPLFRHDNFINASTGESVNTINKIHHIDTPAQGITNYHGERSFTVDSTNTGLVTLQNTIGGGIHTVNMNGSYNFENEFVDLDNIWNSPYPSKKAGVDVHWGIERTYDYFSTIHNHQSFDNNNAFIKSRVNYGGYNSGPNSSFWDGQQLTFGTGGQNFNTLTSLEIVAHEYTHGITEHTAGLNYSYESGALNESFSDIFGYCAHRYIDSATSSYRIGALVAVDTNSAIRNMANPNEFNDPDTYLGSHWYYGSGDDGGVHTNSGVQNFWFYLLVNGGIGTNDNGNGYNLSGIGLEKASRIAFRNLSTYLTPTSTYLDARAGSIQATKDLYGACSTEVLEVTNAWYAVGVGSVYNNAVNASFTAVSTSSCVNPFTVQFLNGSTNNTTNVWDFGDGHTSTEFNPIHEYDSSGVFTVTLSITGDALCGNVSDTTTIVDYIEVGELEPLTPVSCNTPFTYSSSAKVYYLKLGGLEHYPNINQAVVDYTCLNDISVQVGTKIPFYFIANGSVDKMNIFIDYDNSGSFTENEEVYNDYLSGVSAFDTIVLYTSQTTIEYNTPLRMRVILSENETSDGCSQIGVTGSSIGQQLDYRITLLENENPPIADISFVDLSPNNGAQFTINDTIQFLDVSQNIPENYYWEFPGGEPLTSTEENPKVTYSIPGFYGANLKVENSYGEDSIATTHLFQVTNNINICETSSSNVLAGTLFDSGGPLWNYDDNENCSFLIDPGCAESITLSFSSFHTSNYYDYIRVYDGTDNTGILILEHSGSILPGDAIALSGKMYIEFTSGPYYTNYSGWVANWYSTVPSTPPVADFTTIDTIFPLNYPIDFSESTSSNILLMDWDFGDGTTSQEFNPTHQYTTQGLKEVTLSVYNCLDYDTITKYIYIESSPQIEIIQDTIQVDIHCATDTTVSFDVTNTDGGDLYFEAHSNNSIQDTLSVLILANGMNQSCLDTIASYITENIEKSQIEFKVCSTAAEIELGLADKDLVILPRIYIHGSIKSALSLELNQFVNDGGRILMLSSDWDDVMHSTSTYSYSSNSVIPVVINEHPIVDSIPIIGGNGYKYAKNFTHPDYFPILEHEVVWYTGKDLVGILPKGDGEVYYLGYEYNCNFYSNLPDYAKTIFNSTINHIYREVVPTWLNVDEPYQLLGLNDTTTVFFDINTERMFEGHYFDSIQVYSNDSANPVTQVYVDVNIESVYDLQTIDTLDFASIYQFGTVTDSFEILNNACETIVFDSITFDNANVSISQSTDSLLGYSKHTFVLTYSSDSSQILNEYLKFYYDGQVKEILILAECIPAAILTYSPSTIIDSVEQCNDSVTTTLTLYNLGEDPLSGTLFREDSWSVFEGSGLKFYEGFESTYTDNWFQTSTNAFNTLLDPSINSKVLSVDYPTNSNQTIYRPIEENTIDYIAFKMNRTYSQATNAKLSIGSGGATPIAGMCEIEFRNGQTRFRFGGGNYRNYYTNTSIYYHVEFKNINYQLKTFDLYVNGNNIESNVSFFNESVVNNQIALESGTSSSSSRRLYIDDIKVGDFQNSFWMNSVDTVQINPGDSQLIELTLFSEGLNEGWYNGYIHFNTNAINFDDSINVQFKVTGDPFLEIPNLWKNLQNVQQYDTKRDSVVVYNTGCSELEITSITNLRSEYTLSYSSNLVPPDDSVWVYIDFAPLTVDLFEDTITVYTNNNTSYFYLTGESDGLAILHLDAYNTVLTGSECDGEQSIELDIHNLGTIPLNTEINKITSFTDNFESNIISSFWEYSDGIEVGAGCGTIAGQNSLIFNGGGIRILESKTISITEETVFSYKLKSGDEECNTPSGSRYFKLYYSLDNGVNWILHKQFYPYASSVNPVNITETFSNDMLNKPIRFKFEQDNHAGNQTDVWMLDDVRIIDYSSALGDISVLPGDSLNFTTSVNYSDFSNGLNILKYSLESNDPINPMQTYICSLYVNAPPCANFTPELSTPCSGTVNMNAFYRNLPSTVTWEFGDASNSIETYPVHEYESSGTHTITMYACNANGCDTIVKSIQVFEIIGARGNACIPSATLTAIGDVVEFKLGNIFKETTYNGYNHEDFTCTDTTTLIPGADYKFEIKTTKASNKHIAIWLDLNNDGTFQDSELLYDKPQITTPLVDSIFIPITAEREKPLRLRVMSDRRNSQVTPCMGLEAQYEDYSVYISNSKIIPEPRFTFVETDMCLGTFEFNNTSYYTPETYYWNFGDGTYSNEENPIHTFGDRKPYNVSLTVGNSVGNKTLTQQITPNRPSSQVEVVAKDLSVNNPIIFSLDSSEFTDAVWDFNTGNTYTGLQVEVNLPIAKAYPYSIQLTHVMGCEQLYKDTFDLSVVNETFLPLYPNPNSGTFTVEAPIKDYYVFDSMGNEVYRFIGDTYISNQVVRLNHLADGQYIIKAKLENQQTRMAKITIIK